MKINKSGVWGEIYASRYLRDSGLSILAGNYRRRLGEIDIIAKENNTIVFCEVKTRGERYLFEPFEAVDAAKQKKIKAAAALFLKESNYSVFSRFDVIEVYLNSDLTLKKINHIKDAF